MRENEEFGHYVPLLRRVIILVAIITAVPVILWTITAFVRTYIGPPKIPTFHQLASVASINAPSSADKTRAANDRTAPPDQAKPTDQTTGTVEARATTTDAPAAKSSYVSDHAEGDGSPPLVGAPKIADLSPATGVPAAAPESGPNTVATLQPSPAMDDTATAAAPLSGRIPLPRRRPRDAGGVHVADIAPANVPMPRPRPESAGPGAPAESSGGGSPLDFIQNIFH
jgi:hypothetical protein